MLADGSKHASDSYVLHEVQVGDHIVRNVVASVVSVNGAALLGQSFLSKLPAWSNDNTRQALVIADGAGATPSTPAAPATTPVSPALSQYGAIAWDEGTGKRGWSLNQDTPQRAAEVALLLARSFLRFRGGACPSDYAMLARKKRRRRRQCDPLGRAHRADCRSSELLLPAQLSNIKRRHHSISTHIAPTHQTHSHSRYRGELIEIVQREFAICITGNGKAVHAPPSCYQ